MEAAVRIIVDDGSIQREFVGDSLLIADGAIRTGEGTLHNVLALGLEIAGRVELELVGAEGKLIVMGAQLHIEPAGDATYVERFA